MGKEEINKFASEESENKAENQNMPNYYRIGRCFKSISFIIALYFVVNFILELVPKFYPKGFWNKNIDVFKITENEVNTISNNYSLLNLISSVFFFIMIITIINKLSQIGNEFLGNEFKIKYKNNISESKDIDSLLAQYETENESQSAKSAMVIISIGFIVVGIVLLCVFH